VNPTALPILRLGAGMQPSEEALRSLVADRVASRLFGRDAGLWGPEARQEAEIRLGWVDAPERSRELLPEIAAVRDALRSRGIDRIVLCGMGGSSLAPEVIARRDGAPLTVLDSTHPAQVRRALAELPRTAAVVSSKSGSTVETVTHLADFEAAFAAAGIDPSERIVIVTDPGSRLETHARERGYRVFLADPEVGGRYSALTAFGLVPSVLAGADGAALLREAAAAADALRTDSPDNPGLVLAAAIASGLPERYVACTAERGPRNVGLTDWIEQLVAESTGKHGRGVLPIALSADAPELTGALPASAFAVELAVDPDPGELTAEALGAGDSNTAIPDLTIRVAGTLGAQLLLWETATAVLGRLIGVDPFDQPDVESAKAAARALLESGGGPSEPGTAPSEPAELIEELRAAVRPGDYLTVQAFLDRGVDPHGTDPHSADRHCVDPHGTGHPLDDLRESLALTLGVPVALGFGPRYLHSTGQFHKGGPPVGVFLQVLDETLPDGSDPDAIIDSAIIDAQARGDRQVLEEHGRPVFAITSSQVAELISAASTR
jgi:glucose-6-phosphate isomerase